MHLVFLLLTMVLAAPLWAGSGNGIRGEGPKLVDRFASVAGRIEAVAERECRRRTQGMNCDFQMVLDKRAFAAPNARQTLDNRGRPIIKVTRTLIEKLNNADELAFVIAHEAGHHIAGHLPRSRGTLGLAQIQYGSIKMPGVTPVSADAGQTGKKEMQRYFELEADAFAAFLSRRAGFNARKGAQCISRMHHPGHGRHASHPAHEMRLQLINAVLR